MNDSRIAKQRTDQDCGSVLLPEGAGPARLIVCERTGRWAVALRRELSDAKVRLQETRSIAECWEVLAGAPAGLAVVELTAPVVGELLEHLARLQRELPLARVAVVADRGLSDYEWLMREAGAVHFCCSPRRLGPLASLAVSHLAEAPQPRQSITGRIWADLPWR